MRAELAEAQEALEKALHRMTHLEQQRVKDVEEIKASFEREKQGLMQLLELGLQRDKEQHQAHKQIEQLEQEIAQLRAMLPPEELTPSSLLPGKGKRWDLQWAQSDLGAPVTVCSEMTDTLTAASLQVVHHASA